MRENNNESREDFKMSEPSDAKELAVEKKDNNTAKWLAGVLVLGVLVIALAAGMIVYMERSRDYKNRLENVYQQSFYDAAASMDNIEVKLSKLILATSTTQKAELGADIWRQSSMTATELSNLPIDNEGVTETLKFVNQLGDYVHVLTNKLSNGEEITASEEQALEDMHARAQELNARLRGFSDKLVGNYMITDHITRRSKDKLGNADMNDALNGTDGNITDYPKLIYDGPFSDSLEAKDYRFLSDKPAIDEVKGREWINNNIENASNVEYLGLIEGETKTLFFRIAMNDGSETYLQLTEKGGYPIVLSSNKDAPSIRITDEDAIQRAEEYASRVFGSSLNGVWYTKSKTDNTAFINLAPIVDDIVYYTDLVKVKLSLNDGSVLGIESRSYLINHADKQLEPVQISEKEALTIVSKKLDVAGIRLAVIPLELDRYCLTYEIQGKYKDLTFMVYVDANSGEEVQYLRTINNAQGEMLM